MIPAGRFDGPCCILSLSNLSTEDDATEFKGEYCPTLKLGLMSLAIEMDPIEDRSANETLDLRFSALVVTSVAVTLLFT
jgi:hypothetical protein